jgi:hypothetical protein
MPVLTLVVLADDQPNWRPCYYEEALLGCRLRFDFSVCKLLDLVSKAESLAEAGKPPAIIVLANWAAQTTVQDMRERLSVKWDLTRRLYDAGLDRQDILELYRLVDWLLRLPEGLEQDFKQRVRTYEQSKIMPYVTSIERLARAEGGAEVILRLLRHRWKSLAPVMEQRIRALPSEQLENLAEAVLDFGSPSELEAWLAAR